MLHHERHGDDVRTTGVTRVLYFIMGAYLAASGIVMLDQSGVTGEDSAVDSIALAIRETQSGDDPFGVIEEVENMIDAYRRIADAFEDAGNALG